MTKSRKLTTEEIQMLRDELRFLESSATSKTWSDQAKMMVRHLESFGLPKPKLKPLKNDLKRYNRCIRKVEARKRITPEQILEKREGCAAPVLERLAQAVEILAKRYR